MLTPCFLNESHTTILLVRRSFSGREIHYMNEWLTFTRHKERKEQLHLLRCDLQWYARLLRMWWIWKRWNSPHDAFCAFCAYLPDSCLDTIFLQQSHQNLKQTSLLVINSLTCKILTDISITYVRIYDLLVITIRKSARIIDGPIFWKHTLFRWGNETRIVNDHRYFYTFA